VFDISPSQKASLSILPQHMWQPVYGVFGFLLRRDLHCASTCDSACRKGPDLRAEACRSLQPSTSSSSHLLTECVSCCCVAVDTEDLECLVEAKVTALCCTFDLPCNVMGL